MTTIDSRNNQFSLVCWPITHNQSTQVRWTDMKMKECYRHALMTKIKQQPVRIKRIWCDYAESFIYEGLRHTVTMLRLVFQWEPTTAQSLWTRTAYRRTWHLSTSSMTYPIGRVSRRERRYTPEASVNRTTGSTTKRVVVRTAETLPGAYSTGHRSTGYGRWWNRL